MEDIQMGAYATAWYLVDYETDYDLPALFDLICIYEGDTVQDIFDACFECIGGAYVETVFVK
jgi:hypothetical protein